MKGMLAGGQEMALGDEALPLPLGEGWGEGLERRAGLGTTVCLAALAPYREGTSGPWVHTPPSGEIGM